jgi:hypothetical protein
MHTPGGQNPIFGKKLTFLTENDTLQAHAEGRLLTQYTESITPSSKHLYKSTCRVSFGYLRRFVRHSLGKLIFKTADDLKIVVRRFYIGL